MFHFPYHKVVYLSKYKSIFLHGITQNRLYANFLRKNHRSGDKRYCHKSPINQAI
jgi:hypothetical protein